MLIKISVPSLLQKFEECKPDYISNVCNGRCCQGTSGLMVTIHDTEIEKFISMGVEIENNLIVDKNNSGICPFKKNGFCTIHEDKPFGCKASPFTLSKNNVLIIRNRYRLFKCYNTANSKPAYISHRWSLNQIFGENEVDNIIKKIESGCLDVWANIDDCKLKILIDNDKTKKEIKSWQN